MSDTVATSLLAYREYRPPSGASPKATVIALHDYGRHLDQLVPVSEALPIDVRVVAVEAPRMVTPYTQPFVPVDEGACWFPEPLEPAAPPDTNKFGDSLWRLEQFVVDVLKRQEHASVPLVLIGAGQGGVMALSLAGVMPEYVSAIVSIGGHLPRIPRWSFPVDAAGQLPVLLITDGDERSGSPRNRSDTDRELERWGCLVDVAEVRGSVADPLVADQAISEWLQQTLQPAGSRQSKAPVPDARRQVSAG